MMRVTSLMVWDRAFEANDQHNGIVRLADGPQLVIVTSSGKAARVPKEPASGNSSNLHSNNVTMRGSGFDEWDDLVGRRGSVFIHGLERGRTF